MSVWLLLSGILSTVIVRTPQRSKVQGSVLFALLLLWRAIRAAAGSIIAATQSINYVHVTRRTETLPLFLRKALETSTIAQGLLPVHAFEAVLVCRLHLLPTATTTVSSRLRVYRVVAAGVTGLPSGVLVLGSGRGSSFTW